MQCLPNSIILFFTLSIRLKYLDFNVATRLMNVLFALDTTVQKHHDE